MEIRSRVVPGLLVAGLVVGGGGAVIAAAGGSSSHRSAAKVQYCDPKDKGCKKKKHAKIIVRHYPRHRCYSGRLTYRIRVVNKHRNGRIRVYIDGRWRTSTTKSSLKVRLHVNGMSPGRHRLTIGTRGEDGKVVTKTVHFRRC